MIILCTWLVAAVARPLPVPPPPPSRCPPPPFCASSMACILCSRATRSLTCCSLSMVMPTSSDLERGCAMALRNSRAMVIARSVDRFR